MLELLVVPRRLVVGVLEQPILALKEGRMGEHLGSAVVSRAKQLTCLTSSSSSMGGRGGRGNTGRRSTGTRTARDPAAVLARLLGRGRGRKVGLSGSLGVRSSSTDRAVRSSRYPSGSASFSSSMDHSKGGDSARLRLLLAPPSSAESRALGVEVDVTRLASTKLSCSESELASFAKLASSSSGACREGCSVVDGPGVEWAEAREPGRDALAENAVGRRVESGLTSQVGHSGLGGSENGRFASAFSEASVEAMPGRLEEVLGGVGCVEEGLVKAPLGGVDGPRGR